MLEAKKSTLKSLQKYVETYLTHVLIWITAKINGEGVSAAGVGAWRRVSPIKALLVGDCH